MATLAVGVAMALTAPGAAAAAGDVYVADPAALAILKLGPAGGEATVLADDPDLDAPNGIALGPDGRLYVADQYGELFKVNRATGAVTQLAELPDGLWDVAFDARGRLLAVNASTNTISVVNRRTGAASTIFDAPISGFNSLAPARSGGIFVADEVADKVFRLQGGTLTEVAATTNPSGIILSPDERYLYIGSFSEPRFVRYDLRSDQSVPFEIGIHPWWLAMLPSNRLLLSDQFNGDLDTVGLTGGTPAPFSSDPDLMLPQDLAVAPRLCGGRIPTVVGTNAGEVIRGSSSPDVISTLGGNDVVRSLGGKDVVCGGSGRDKLIGGGKRDRLLGQGGRDRLVGGKGRDICRGGPGRDRQLGCP